MLIHSQQMAFCGLGRRGDPAENGAKQVLLGVLSKKMCLGLKEDCSQVGMSDYRC